MDARRPSLVFAAPGAPVEGDPLAAKSNLQEPNRRIKFRRRTTRVAHDKTPKRRAPLSASGPMCPWRWLINLMLVLASSQALASGSPGEQAAAGASFPGVSRDLASFCSARPSLSIELASMIVHVKKATSFNYKLYLFSADNFVFQTGQIVPRDDFRIHSFPVKLKHLSEFLPARVATFEQSQAGLLVPVSSDRFDARRFLAQVPVDSREALRAPPPPPSPRGRRRAEREQPASGGRQQQQVAAAAATSFDVPDDTLPGDEPGQRAPLAHHDVALASRLEPPNSSVHFDRDDQVAILNSARARDFSGRESANGPGERQPPRAETEARRHQFASNERLITPVGAFSSFQVNSTYLVRKDFDQREPELVRLQIDPARFQVSQVELLTRALKLDEHAFLGHKLLMDPNTRITAINQIYEDWITRNFYTVVYIQRRLETAAEGGPNSDELPSSSSSSSSSSSRAARLEGDGESEQEPPPPPPAAAIVTDRLIFRGSSIVLLGADQLDYQVKAAAFITEKNGLHYYFEFLARGKFYLAAIDWTKRPFTIVDAQRFPLRQTRTKFDNEELLLCPPAVCYSERPVDELVAYGRLALADRLSREAAISTRALAISSNETAREPIDNLDGLSGAVRAAAANQLEVKLHLRDWTWTLPRVRAGGEPSASRDTKNSTATTGAAAAAAAAHSTGPEPAAASRFGWHYEWARRNSIKAAHDNYGFVLTGHEIDASYRVYNELYLISANHLITINYTLANETVTSAHPLADEFQGLGSSFADPVTGAYYDRHANQLYFFKGDRYVGYDYATKRPLEDFLLPAPLALEALVEAGGAGGDLTLPAPPLPNVARRQQPLVSSLPVVGILGRQHYVDAVYHDLHDDLVHVVAGDKFYAHRATDFKDGAFKTDRQPAWRCLNEHLFEGCRFDEAFPNPCSSSDAASRDEVGGANDVETGGGGAGQRQQPQQKQAGNATSQSSAGRQRPLAELRLKQQQNEVEFNEEQQMKLRSIAARGGVAGGGLLDVLLENALRNHGSAARMAAEPFLMHGTASMPAGPHHISTQSTPQERIVIYLLITMVLITILVTAAMVFVVLNWARAGSVNLPQDDGGNFNDLDGAQADHVKKTTEHHMANPTNGAHMLTERVPYPPAISQYLTNQYHNQRQQQHQHATNSYHQQARRQQAPVYLMDDGGGGDPPQLHHAGPPPRRSSQPPLPAPPPPQSQLFQALNKQAKLAKSAASGSRMVASRHAHGTIVDSSAL